MRPLFLLIVGLMLVSYSFTGLGLVTLIAAVLLPNGAEKLWSFILGAILLLSLGWLVSGALAILFAICEE